MELETITKEEANNRFAGNIVPKILGAMGSGAISVLGVTSLMQIIGYNLNTATPDVFTSEAITTGAIALWATILGTKLATHIDRDIRRYLSNPQEYVRNHYKRDLID